MPYVSPRLPAVGSIQAVGRTGFRSGLLRAQNAGANYVHTFSRTLSWEQHVRVCLRDHCRLNYVNNVMGQLGVPGINVDADSSGSSLFAVSGFQQPGGLRLDPDHRLQQHLPVFSHYNEEPWHAYLQGRCERHRAPHHAVPERLTERLVQLRLQSDQSNGAGSGGNSVAASSPTGYPSSTSRSETLHWPDFRTRRVRLLQRRTTVG